jgi:uncharacterized protein (TIGR02145 family)
MYRKVSVLMAMLLICSMQERVNGQTVSDADGNIYTYVKIGNQIWLATNLKTTKFNDGTEIPLVTGEKMWKDLNTPAYCWFNNDISNKAVYGGLYNWYAVSTKKLCPKGWHVPTGAEWNTLIAFIGREETAGDKLKETGTDHWKSSLNFATNEYDFTALPGGMRLASGDFPLFGNSYCVWWSATGSGTKAWNRGLFFSSSRIFSGNEDKKSGFSVRCLKD